MGEMARQILHDVIRHSPVPLDPAEIVTLTDAILTGLDRLGMEVAPVEVCSDCLEPQCRCGTAGEYEPGIVDVPTGGLL